MVLQIQMMGRSLMRPLQQPQEVVSEQSKTQLEPLQHLPLQAEEIQIGLFDTGQRLRLLTITGNSGFVC